MNENPQTGRFLGLSQQQAVCLFLVLAALIVFAQTLGHGFSGYDDDVYVTDNRFVKAGLTLEGVSWAFSTSEACFWHPLVWVSYMTDAELFHGHPLGYHFTNLLLHIVSTLLLFAVLNRATGSLWRSGFVAALFAVHPLHVESVAWVAQRKDTLSTVFWMLTMWAYVFYAEKPGPGRYALVVVCLLLGLMAKPMLVTLPFVLLLLDYWPLRRFGGSPHPYPLPLRGCTGEGESEGVVLRGCTGKAAGTPSPVRESANGTGEGRGEGSGLPVTRYSLLVRQPLSTSKRLVIEKVPLLLLSIVFSVIAYRAQSAGGALGNLSEYTAGIRLANMPVSYATYIRKMFWPADLAVFYPHPGDRLPVWQVVGSLILLVALTVAAWRAAKRRPYVGMGWLWFLGTLIPVIGIVQVGGHAVADRYTYVPLVGLFIIAAWGIPDLVKGGKDEWKRGRSSFPPFLLSSPLPITAAVSIIALMTCAYIQAGYWDTSIKLFRRAIAVTRNNHIAHNNLGVGYKWSNKLDRAILHFRRALELWPGYPDAQLNLGTVLIAKGRIDEAMAVYRKAIRSTPREPMLYYNYAIALSQLRRFDEALAQYKKATDLRPDYVSAQMNMGILLARLGRHEEAIAHLSAAVKAQPEYAKAHYNLAAELHVVGEYSRALEELDLAEKHGLRIPPWMRESIESEIVKE